MLHEYQIDFNADLPPDNYYCFDVMTNTQYGNKETHFSNMLVPKCIMIIQLLLLIYVNIIINIILIISSNTSIL